MMLLLTARRISALTGFTRQGVAKALKNIPASGRLEVSGNLAQAWAYADLPESLRAQIANRARRAKVPVDHYLAGEGSAGGGGDWLDNLRVIVAGVRDPMALTRMERDAVWTSAAGAYFDGQAEGVGAKEAVGSILDLLWDAVPGIGKRNRPAMAQTLRFWRKRFAKAQGDMAKVKDMRAAANQARRKVYGAEDVDRVVWNAATRWGGHVAPAVRDLSRRGELSPALLQDLESRTSRKSDLPKSLARVTVPVSQVVAKVHQGKRAVDKLVPSLDLGYDGIASFAVLMADDFTFPVYFYVEDGAGWYRLTRGQVILVIDFRSLRILSFGLTPEEQPNSLVVRTAFVRAFEEFSLPDILYLERGKVFQGSKLVTGGPAPAYSDAELHQGLGQHGIKFIHARRARSKPVERVGGLLQDRMMGELGFSGRRADHSDVPDSLRRQMREVESRQCHPSKYFYSLGDWNVRLGEICQSYNAEPQEGKRLAGLSPDTCAEKFIDRSKPRTVFPAQLRAFLAHHRIEGLKVHPSGQGRAGGVQFTVPRYGAKRYFSEELGHWIGKRVVAFFNPEAPEYCSFALEENPCQIVAAPMHQSPNALRTDEVFESETAKAQSFLRPVRRYYQVLKAKFKVPARQVVTDRATVRLAEELARKPAELRAHERQQENLERKGRRALAKYGLVPEGPLTADRVAAAEELDQIFGDET